MILINNGCKCPRVLPPQPQKSPWDSRGQFLPNPAPSSCCLKLLIPRGLSPTSFHVWVSATPSVTVGARKNMKIGLRKQTPKTPRLVAGGTRIALAPWQQVSCYSCSQEVSWDGPLGGGKSATMGENGCFGKENKIKKLEKCSLSDWRLHVKARGHWQAYKKLAP